MNSWMAAMLDVARKVTQTSAGGTDLYVFGGVGLIVTLGVFKLMATITGNRNASLFSSVALVFGTVALMLAAAATVRRYFFAGAEWSATVVWATGGAAAAAGLLVAGLMKLWHRISYLAAAMTLIIALTAAALVMAGVRTGYQAVRHGKSQAGRMEEHNRLLRTLENP